MNKINPEKKTEVPFAITGDWALRSGELKREFPELSDSDLLFEKGREQELVNRIATRLQKNQEEVISILKRGRLERFE
jgi:hypothetical protein